MEILLKPWLFNLIGNISVLVLDFSILSLPLSLPLSLSLSPPLSLVSSLNEMRLCLNGVITSPCIFLWENLNFAALREPSPYLHEHRRGPVSESVEAPQPTLRVSPHPPSGDESPRIQYNAHNNTSWFNESSLTGAPAYWNNWCYSRRGLSIPLEINPSAQKRFDLDPLWALWLLLIGCSVRVPQRTH